MDSNDVAYAFGQIRDAVEFHDEMAGGVDVTDQIIDELETLALEALAKREDAHE